MATVSATGLRSGFQAFGSGLRSAKTGTLSVRVLVDIVQMADTVLLTAAGVVAFIAAGLSLQEHPTGEFVIATLIASAAAIMLLRRGEAYTIERLAVGPRQFRPSITALAYAAALSSLCLLVLRVPPQLVGLWSVAWLLGTAASLTVFRATLAPRIARWAMAGKFDNKVAVVGVNRVSQEFLTRVQSGGFTRTQIVGVYESGIDEGAELGGNATIRGDIDTLMLDCRLRTVDAIVIALPASSGDEIERITARLRPCVADLYLLSDVGNVDATSSHFSDIGTRRVVPVAKRPLRDWREVQKSLFDRAAASLLLLLMMPFLLAVALAIRVTSPGPILFRQMRMGFNNNLFRIYKFRTMHVHLTDRLADRQTSRNDSRVTSIGRLLRKLSIDELPQLINVVRGEMSLVGPRPHAPGTRLGSRRVDEVVSGYAQRHRVKPGITGLAQINGFRGEMATEEQVRMRVQYDLEYIRTWSLWLDIKILLLTVGREINSRRAF